jgi:hypothetical protein
MYITSPTLDEIGVLFDMSNEFGLTISVILAWARRDQSLDNSNTSRTYSCSRVYFPHRETSSEHQAYVKMPLKVDSAILAGPGFSFTKRMHRSSYPAISPLRPELSQAGRVVLITGSSQGVGFYIARGFAEAGASIIIILGRREKLVNDAVSQLEKEYVDTKFLAFRVDIASTPDVETLWSCLERDGVVVDVLVLNAARISHPRPIMTAGREDTWADFVTNVKANLDLTELFYKQTLHDPNKKLVSAASLLREGLHAVLTRRALVSPEHIHVGRPRP